MNSFKLVLTVFIFMLVVFSPACWPHGAKPAVLDLDISETDMSGNWWISALDLHMAIDLDANKDSVITYYEFKQKRKDMLLYMQNNLFLFSGDSGCQLNVAEPQLSRTETSVFIQMPFQSNCHTNLSLRYTVLAEIDFNHRLIANISSGGKVQTLIMKPDESSVKLIVDEQSRWISVAQFIQQGVIHILEGYDHLLFLLALLVPIVASKLKKRSGVNGLRELTFPLLKITGAFTVGHSATLILASVFNYSPPMTWVEVIIACSVFIAGLNIVFGFFRESSWKIAGTFGLIHGFGFASVLAEIELARANYLVSLLSFNLGVEIGQLMVIVLAMPLLLVLVAKPKLASVTRYSSASFAAIFGLIWMVERLPL